MATKPTNNNELNAERNKLKLKHAMLGAMIWYSLLDLYQLDIIGDEDKFKMGLEYNGVTLWYYILKEINPLTTTGAARFKDQIEYQTLKDFRHDVKKFNVWFTDTRLEIIKLHQEVA